MTSIRLLTYNVLGGRATRALRSVVRAVDADVVVVNESPRLPLLWRRQCSAMVCGWGLTYAAGGRDAGRNLVACGSRVEVLPSRVERLPQPRRQPIRGVVSAQLRVDGRRFGVVGCHLGLRAAARLDEVERVLRHADRLDGPVVVAGDLNEPPQAPCWQRLRKAGFVDAGTDGDRTFPSAGPVRRIDALLVRGDVRVVGHGVPALSAELLRRASDHLPVAATLRWP